MGTLPFDAVAFGSSVAVVNSGYASGPQSVSIVYPATAAVTRTLPVPTVFPSAVAGPGVATGIDAVDERILAVTYAELPIGAGLRRAAHVAVVDTVTGTVTRDAKISDYGAYAIQAGPGLCDDSSGQCGRGSGPRGGALLGYVPTGWYPTKVLVTGGNLVVVSAKGTRPLRPNVNGACILTLLQGAAGVIAKAAVDANLAAWTARVLTGSPTLRADTPIRACRC